MNRRDFLKKASIVTLGTIFIPTLFSCERECIDPYIPNSGSTYYNSGSTYYNSGGTKNTTYL